MGEEGVEYYSVIKMTMPLTASSTQLEIIILSELNQNKKNKHHMILLICGI